MSWRRLLYTLLLYALTPLFLLRLYWRGFSSPAYRERMRERFGFVSSTHQACLWVHAVSVGETVAARPLIEHLLAAYPNETVWVTTTTPTGSATVRRLFADRVSHSYVPYDLPGALRRFVRRVRPRLLVVMETEIWPNLYAVCAEKNIPLMLANARLSERSVRGYARLGGLTRAALENVRLLAARGEQDARYFRQLGMPEQRIHVCGNLKFDLRIPAGLREEARHLRAEWGAERPVWVAASTHAGEDEIILPVFARLKSRFPKLLLILAPRHPERFATVAGLCANSGFQVIQRGSGQAFTPEMDILLADSMGELLRWYAAADMAFIGGSLIPQGGHNPLEAAALGVPAVSGEQIHNFTDIFPLLCKAGGAVLVKDAAGLEARLRDWLENAPIRNASGQAAQRFFLQNQGALACLARYIQDILQTTTEVDDERD